MNTQNSVNNMNGYVEIRSPFGIHMVPEQTLYGIIHPDSVEPPQMQQPVILNWEEQVKKHMVDSSPVPVTNVQPSPAGETQKDKPEAKPVNARLVEFDVIGVMDGITFMAHKSISSFVSRLPNVADTERFISGYCKNNNLVLDEGIFAMSAFSDSTTFEFKPSGDIYNSDGELVHVVVYVDKAGIHLSTR